jgi:HK97 gp10 family phage protein
MAGDVTVRIQGMDQALATLRTLPDRLRKRALRNALAAGGRVIRDAARRSAPVIDPMDPAVQRGERAVGTVRRAIVVRTSKQARRQGNVGVYVNVRPAKGSQRGAKSPRDPFYWRFLEFGTKRHRAYPFLRPSASRLQDAFEAFRAAIGPVLARMNVPGARVP